MKNSTLSQTDRRTHTHTHTHTEWLPELLSEPKIVIFSHVFFTTWPFQEEMRDTNESTNSRVLYFSIFSMCCLLGLATWQVRAKSNLVMTIFSIIFFFPGPLPQKILQVKETDRVENALQRWVTKVIFVILSQPHLCYVEVLLHSNDLLLLNYDIQYKYIFLFLMC